MKVNNLFVFVLLSLVAFSQTTPAARTLTTDQVAQLSSAASGAPAFICSVQSLQGDTEAAALADQIDHALQCGAGDRNLGSDTWKQLNIPAKGVTIWEAGKDKRTGTIVGLLKQFGFNPVTAQRSNVKLRRDQPSDDGKQRLVLILIGANQ